MAAGGPEPIANIITELFARRGLGQRQAVAQRERAWQDAVGEEMARHTRCGNIRRGRLEIIVANSLLMQELTFQKPDILTKLSVSLTETKIEDIKFRVGSMS